MFDSELIDALPESVKYICHNGAGYDQIDLVSSTRRGIEVSHTPGAVDDATATTAMFLILSSLRQYWKAETNARSGKWKQGLSPAHDPEGKTIGIIGMGGIGSVVGQRCLAFGMKVIYHNRNPISPAPSFECEYVSDRDELLKRSDIVSLNLPLNEKTKGSFGKEQFEKMKDGSILINTARGGVVDQEALVEALTNGKVSVGRWRLYPPTHTLMDVFCFSFSFSPHPTHPAALLGRSGRLPKRTRDRSTTRRDGLHHPPAPYGNRSPWDSTQGQCPQLNIRRRVPLVLLVPLTRSHVIQMECQALKNIASALTGKGLINQVAEQKQK